MTLVIDKKDTKALKSFALTMSWAFPAFFTLLLPWLFNYAIQIWPLYISLTLMTLFVVKPAWLYGPFRVWMFIGGILGWINTRIILGLSFYILIAPLGIVLSAFGKLQYKKKMPTNSSTSYVKPDAKSKKDSLEYPF